MIFCLFVLMVCFFVILCFLTLFLLSDCLFLFYSFFFSLFVHFFIVIVCFHHLFFLFIHFVLLVNLFFYLLVCLFFLSQWFAESIHNFIVSSLAIYLVIKMREVNVAVHVTVKLCQILLLVLLLCFVTNGFGQLAEYIVAWHKASSGHNPHTHTHT